MRTNIVINEELFAEASRYARGRTRRAVVEEALATFVRVKAREVALATYSQRAHDLEARLASLRLRQSPAGLLREDRNRT